VHSVALEHRISENGGIIKDIHCQIMDSVHVVIMKNDLQRMKANLLEENRRDCEISIASVDVSCNRE
jgi:hypothetical protein